MKKFIDWPKNAAKVPSGFPNFSVPLKPIEATNGTNGTEISAMIGELGYGIVVIPFVAIVANVGIAKAFGKVIQFKTTKSE